MLQTHKPIPFELEWLWISIDFFFQTIRQSTFLLKAKRMISDISFIAEKLGKNTLNIPLSSDAVEARIFYCRPSNKRGQYSAFFPNAIFILLIENSYWTWTRASVAECNWLTKTATRNKSSLQIIMEIEFIPILIGCTANCTFIAVN